jgi:hypothetical protein
VNQINTASVKKYKDLIVSVLLYHKSLTCVQCLPSVTHSESSFPIRYLSNTILSISPVKILMLMLMRMPELNINCSIQLSLHFTNMTLCWASNSWNKADLSLSYIWAIFNSGASIRTVIFISLEITMHSLLQHNIWSHMNHHWSFIK